MSIQSVSPARQAAILDLLIRPTASVEIAAHLGFSDSAARRYLVLLEQAGIVHRAGGSCLTRWAKKTQPIPKLMTYREKTRGIVVHKRTINPASRMHPKPKPRPAKSQTPQGPLPWWATAARDGFTAYAAKRAEAMRNTKEYFWVPNWMVD